jgi:hypothetical protein
LGRRRAGCAWCRDRPCGSGSACRRAVRRRWTAGQRIDLSGPDRRCLSVIRKHRFPDGGRCNSLIAKRLVLERTTSNKGSTQMPPEAPTAHGDTPYTLSGQAQCVDQMPDSGPTAPRARAASCTCLRELSNAGASPECR